MEIDTGACMVVRGPSGSGKTLLLRAIADLDPCPGDVRLDGVACADTPGPVWRRSVTYVGADSGWWADTVGEHFQDWTRVAAEIGTLGLPAECDAWPVERLSTGERQRLALLRALELQPRVLLLDEPTSGLDADTTQAVEALLAGLRRDGTTLVWVTHDAAQADRVATTRLSLGTGDHAA
ncbi:MAG: ATP-binding cassette domain-containing protein [Halofilum sp. (in: g-proteobacteria)]|nr:ATP-binding cassette domain-containing protein [Halofilum sp. (in: g-proteobacteria)]